MLSNFKKKLKISCLKILGTAYERYEKSRFKKHLFLILQDKRKMQIQILRLNCVILHAEYCVYKG